MSDGRAAAIATKAPLFPGSGTIDTNFHWLIDSRALR
jgi:hypothetical protein